MTNKNLLTTDDVASIVEHMNDDHADAILLYIKAFTDINADDVEEASMTNIDFSGIDVHLKLNGVPTDQKILFSDTGTKIELNDRNKARAVLVDMVKIARNILDSNRGLTGRN